MADDGEDASLIAAQETFLSSRTRPAAKTIRTTGGPATARQEPRPSTDQQPEVETHGPGWYQQMKGVRFRIDDLEDENDVPDETTRNDRPVKTESMGSAVMGDIVEREISSARPVFTRPGSQKAINGFPAPRKFTRSRALAKAPPIESPVADERAPTGQLEGKALMEEIDRENRKKMAEMSEDEILELQKSLQASLPKELQHLLLQKPESSKPDTIPTKPVVEDPTPPTRIAPKGPKVDPTMDDQSFDSHLRTFFPSTTTSVPQPEWTLPVHPAEETFYSTPDSTTAQPSTMRFDFTGKYIPPATSRSLPTHLGLHHHSLDPGSAGYTLAELAILARSTQASQKCIAIKIIGFVLADVARGKTYEWDITEGLWEEIEREKVIEILLDIAKGGREAGGNRSVQRYAEDAVTRWVDAGGPKIWEERLQKKGFEKVDQDSETGDQDTRD